jgi:hypothetical protein
MYILNYLLFIYLSFLRPFRRDGKNELDIFDFISPSTFTPLFVGGVPNYANPSAVARSGYPTHGNGAGWPHAWRGCSDVHD